MCRRQTRVVCVSQVCGCYQLSMWAEKMPLTVLCTRQYQCNNSLPSSGQPERQTRTAQLASGHCRLANAAGEDAVSGKPRRQVPRYEFRASTLDASQQQRRRCNGVFGGGGVGEGAVNLQVAYARTTNDRGSKGGRQRAEGVYVVDDAKRQAERRESGVCVQQE